MPQWWNVRSPEGKVYRQEAEDLPGAIQLVQQRLAQQSQQTPEQAQQAYDMEFGAPDVPAPDVTPRESTWGEKFGAWRRRNPLAMMGLEVAAGVGLGMAVPPLAPALAASKIPRLAGLGARVLRSPKIAQMFGRGAAEGGVVGAALGDEGERAQNAGLDAALGGTLGAAAPVAGRAIRGAANFMSNVIPPTRRGQWMLDKAVQRNNLDTLKDPDGLVGDVVDPAAVRYVQQHAPPEARQLIDATAGRQARAFSGVPGDESRLTAQFEEALEGPPTPATLTEEGHARSLLQEEQFTTAYQEPLPDATRKLAEELRGRPSFAKAEISARQRLADEGVTLENIDTVQAADKTLAALRAAGAKATQQGDADMVRLVDRTRKPLQESLEKNVPAYRTAMNTSRETNLRNDAFTAGRKLFDKANIDGTAKTPSVTTRALAAMTPEARRYFRAGVMDRVMAGASSKKVAANIVSMFSTRGTRDQLKTILPADVFGEFQSYVGKEEKFWKTYKAAQGAPGKDLPTSLRAAVQTGGDILRTAAWYTPFAFNGMMQSILKHTIGSTDDRMFQELVTTLAGRTLPNVRRTAPIKARRGLGTLPGTLREER